MEREWTFEEGDAVDAFGMPIDPRRRYLRGSWITGIPFEEFLRRWRDPAEGYDADLDTESDHELLELCVVDWWCYQPLQERRSIKPDKSNKRPRPDGGSGGGKRRLFSGGAEGEAGGPSSSGCAA